MLEQIADHIPHDILNSIYDRNMVSNIVKIALGDDIPLTNEAEKEQLKMVLHFAFKAEKDAALLKTYKATLDKEFELKKKKIPYYKAYLLLLEFTQSLDKKKANAATNVIYNAYSKTNDRRDAASLLRLANTLYKFEENHIASNLEASARDLPQVLTISFPSVIPSLKPTTNLRRGLGARYIAQKLAGYDFIKELSNTISRYEKSNEMSVRIEFYDPTFDNPVDIVLKNKKGERTLYYKQYLKIASHRRSFILSRDKVSFETILQSLLFQHDDANFAKLIGMRNPTEGLDVSLKSSVRL
jgi:hypothetical protein